MNTGTRIKKTTLFILIIFCFFIVLDVYMNHDMKLSEDRLYDLKEKINKYKLQHGHYPKYINELDLKLSGNKEKESYCDMIEDTLKGIGYCYYYYNQQDKEFYLSIYSYWYISSYNSKSKEENTYLIFF